ncbi:MAG: DNA cytosine methyltransferase [Muribaculaceae bacterium]|nr:DNA cytosine methyltransferase [Muribaculaceae bacterium]
MKIVSLFSGAGGLDLGLVQSGHEILWAIDIDKDAVTTYQNNIGDHIRQGDITKLDMRTLPDCDVIVGGFPCQGFSIANLKRTIDDERNLLYLSFYQAIKIKHPKFFIAENVKGILSLGKGTIVAQIIEDFRQAGYNVTVNLVNMADYGVPQTRQRVIFLGQRSDINDIMLFQLPSKTHSEDGKQLPRWISIEDAISHFPEPGNECDIPNHVCSNYKVVTRNFTGHRVTDPHKPSPTILARGNGGGGVVAIPHYSGMRRLTIRESASIQTFPDDFVFYGAMNSCYRQIGNAVPVHFAKLLGNSLNNIVL